MQQAVSRWWNRCCASFFYDAGRHLLVCTVVVPTLRRSTRTRRASTTMAPQAQGSAIPLAEPDRPTGSINSQLHVHMHRNTNFPFSCPALFTTGLECSPGGRWARSELIGARNTTPPARYSPTGRGRAMAIRRCGDVAMWHRCSVLLLWCWCHNAPASWHGWSGAGAVKPWERIGGTTEHRKQQHRGPVGRMGVCLG